MRFCFSCTHPNIAAITLPFVSVVVPVPILCFFTSSDTLSQPMCYPKVVCRARTCTSMLWQLSHSNSLLCVLLSKQWCAVVGVQLWPMHCLRHLLNIIFACKMWWMCDRLRQYEQLKSKTILKKFERIKLSYLFLRITIYEFLPILPRI